MSWLGARFLWGWAIYFACISNDCVALWRRWKSDGVAVFVSTRAAPSSQELPADRLSGMPTNCWRGCRAGDSWRQRGEIRWEFRNKANTIMKISCLVRSKLITWFGGWRYRKAEGGFIGFVMFLYNCKYNVGWSVICLHSMCRQSLKDPVKGNIIWSALSFVAEGVQLPPCCHRRHPIRSS